MSNEENIPKKTQEKNLFEEILSNENNYDINQIPTSNHHEELTASYNSEIENNEIIRINPKSKLSVKNKNGFSTKSGSKNLSRNQSKNTSSANLLKNKTKRTYDFNNSIKEDKNSKKNKINEILSCESSKNEDNERNISKNRKLTDEDCLEKMKEKFPNDKGLTKTFITRKLKKKIMINRFLDYINFEKIKNIENTIPKKSGPNNFVKFSLKISSDEDLKLNSNLVYYIKDLFINHFIVLKKTEEKKKILFGGTINKDIINFLKIISSDDFRKKFNLISGKVKTYAFYEELVFEFSNRKDVNTKNLSDEEINNMLKQYDCLEYMRNCYENIKKIRISE